MSDVGGRRVGQRLNAIAVALVAVVLSGSTPKPTAIDATSPHVIGARADCSAITTCTVAWELARQPVRVFAGLTPTDIDRSRPVAVVSDALEATVSVPDPTRTTYFEVVAHRAKHGPIVADPNLRLVAAPNTRDLGGYVAYDGKQVRWGRLFRSDGLDGLTDGDRARLTALGLPAACPTPPSSPASAAPVDAATIRAAAAAVTSRATRDRDRAFLRALAREGLPQWVQCTLLDDRTGWGAALILMTLGVPRETVVANYLQSTALGDPPSPQREYIDTAFEAVRKRYKTFGKYLVNGLGLNERTYLQLRKRLLTSR